MALLVLLLTGLVTPLAYAGKTEIIVYLDDRGCPIYTRTDVENCGNPDHPKDVSCRSPNQKVVWEVSDKSFPRQIEIRWKGEDPLSARCKGNARAENGKITRCKIDRSTPPGDYDYSIWVADDCQMDPRIIVR